MNTPLRFNEALLIADRAFRPFQCVAWAPQDGTGIVNISVVDRTSTRLLGRQLSSATYTDPQQLDLDFLARADLGRDVYGRLHRA